MVSSVFADIKIVSPSNFNIDKIAINGNYVSAAGARYYYDIPSKTLKSVNGIWIYDVSNPIAANIIGTIESSNLTFKGLEYKNNFLYVSCFTDGIKIYNLSSPSNPILVGQYDTPGISWASLLFGNILYVSDGTALLAFNVSNPQNPTLLGQLTGIFPKGTPKIYNNYLYVSGGAGFYVVNVSNPSSMSLANTISYNGYPYSVQDLNIVNGKLFAGAGKALFIYDLTNPISPNKIGTLNVFDDGYYSTIVNVTDDGKYVALAGGGVGEINISNLFSPTWVDNKRTVETARSIVSNGDVIFVSDAKAGLVVFAKSTWVAPTCGAGQTIYITNFVDRVVTNTIIITNNVNTILPSQAIKINRYDSIKSITDAPLPTP